MSISKLKAYLSGIEFRPHTSSLDGVGDITAVISLMARATLTYDGSWGRLSDHLSNKTWDRQVLGFYRDLDEVDRLQVLGVAGTYAHELTHRIDYLTTPFGVRFYGTSCLEFLEFQKFGEEFLRRLETSPMTAVRDLPRVGNSPTARPGPEALIARVKYFDSILGAPRRSIKTGWGGNIKPIRILGRELEKLTIHDLVPTARRPGERSSYLRPQAILEGRAVAVTLGNLHRRLGGNAYASSEVANYLRCFYNPEEVTSDYLLLLDLYASMWDRHATVEELIESRDPTWLADALAIINLATWYSLHSPPIMSRDPSEHFAYSSPMLRILNALHAFGQAIRDEVEFANYEDALNYIDRYLEDEGGLWRPLWPINTVLEYCLGYLKKVQRMNLEENRNAPLRDHFDRVFTIQIEHFRRRQGLGYAYLPGIPSDGNYLSVLGDEDEDLLLDSYSANPEVSNYYALRQNLFFGYARPKGIFDEIRAYIK
jgi:hypothetical protein